MRKKIAAILFSLLLCIGTVGLLPAAAAGGSSAGTASSGKVVELKDLNLKLTVPAGFYSFTQDVTPSDADLKKAGITNWYETKSNMQKQSTSLLISAPGGAYTILIHKKDSSDTQKYYNMKTMSNTDIQKLMDSFSKPQSSVTGNDTAKGTCKRYTSPSGMPFIYVQLQGTQNSTSIQDAAYFTIVNGSSYTVETYQETDPLTSAQTATLKTVADSIQITKTLPKSSQSTNTTALSILILLSPVLLILLIVLVVYLVSRIRRKHEAKRKAVLLQRITEYREKQDKLQEEARIQGIPPAEPEVLVENTTKCVKKALKRFSWVDLLLNRKSTWVTLFITAVLCIFIAIFDSSVPVRVIAIVAAVLCVVYVLRIPHKVFVTEDGSYRKMKTRQVHYQFREEDFHVTGVSSGIYPYVQIARVCETDRYFYLYLGANHVYLVNKHDFTKGTTEDLQAILVKQCPGYKPRKK
ncbi:MAG: YcxB family protein [Oscillospiraceae bacterium]|jgi:hypothetical protein|nr:YcxB family protein [Oscillospiraceae bacterium]MDD3261699.1 YcxB family protein [Oscillospiraceae bacterium]